jgi:hypothetical protein
VAALSGETLFSLGAVRITTATSVSTTANVIAISRRNFFNKTNLTSQLIQLNQIGAETKENFFNLYPVVLQYLEPTPIGVGEAHIGPPLHF